MLSATSLRIAGRSSEEVDTWVLSSGRGADSSEVGTTEDGGDDIVRRQAAAAVDAAEEPDRE